MVNDGDSVFACVRSPRRAFSHRLDHRIDVRTLRAGITECTVCSLCVAFTFCSEEDDVFARMWGR